MINNGGGGNVSPQLARETPLSKSSHPRVSSSSSGDAMDVDEPVMARSQRESEERIKLLREHPELGYQIVSRMPARELHQGLPDKYKAKLSDVLSAGNEDADIFGLAKASEKLMQVAPNGFMHDVMTNVLWVDPQLAANPKNVEEYAKESRRYDDYRNYKGYIPRRIRTDDAIYVGQDENEAM